MAYVKTAISIKEPLLQEADALAHRLNIPRSRLFAMAVEDFINQHQNRQLFDKLNEVYADQLNIEESAYLAEMKKKHRPIIEKGQ
jgi:metal-responsive CopG/Arc/MetJ family transcriptional regulator